MILAVILLPSQEGHLAPSYFHYGSKALDNSGKKSIPREPPNQNKEMKIADSFFIEA